MKTFLKFLLLILVNGSIYGQAGFDLLITSASFAPSAIPQNTNTIYKFNYSIDNLYGTSETLAPGCVKILVGFPASGLFEPVGGANGVIPSTPANKFTWTMVGKTLKGVNNVNLQDGDGGLVQINVIGLAQTPPTTTFTNIFDEGDCTSGNVSGNDSKGAQLEIMAPLPIKLLDFIGLTKDCDHIMLNWTTSSEVNNDYMEILRSNNGKQYTVVGKVKGTNSVTGGTYSFKDETDLQLGRKYYYKIRQVDLDGKSRVYKTIIVNHYCGTMIPEFDIYPNPASDVISVSFSGIAKDQETELVFLNKLGVVAKKLKVKTDETTEIEVRSLPSGVYKIQTLDLDDNLSERFIRIR